MPNKQRQIEQCVNDTITQRGSQAIAGRLGVILSYDAFDNTASVVITKQQTDEIDEVLTKVMCPMTPGVQTVAPTPGQQCWVVFKDNNVTQALITHYYNHRYSQFNYDKQTHTPLGLPSYLLGL